MQAAERAWILQASQGDQEAYARLVDLYWSRICRWLNGMVGVGHLAEDIAQEAFCKAWTALPTLESPDAFPTWFFLITRRCWLDHQRRSKKEPRGPIPAETPTRETGPLGAAMESEAADHLRAALTVLPDKYREAYLLWIQEEVPHHEIAAILGISEETVRWRVCKARQFLVHKLKAHLPNTP